jgi:hypothetical protein
MRILRRTRELAQKHDFGPDEVERTLVAGQPIQSETFDLASLAIQDAAHLADKLWSGNGRTGRSLHDVRELLAGHQVDVPANEKTLAIVLADEVEFEAALVKILTAHGEQDDERALSEIIFKLRRPSSRERRLPNTTGMLSGWPAY